MTTITRNGKNHNGPPRVLSLRWVTRWRSLSCLTYVMIDKRQVMCVLIYRWWQWNILTCVVIFDTMRRHFFKNTLLLGCCCLCLCTKLCNSLFVVIIWTKGNSLIIIGYAMWQAVLTVVLCVFLSNVTATTTITVASELGATCQFRW